MVSFFTKKKINVTKERDFYTPHKRLRAKQKYYCISQKSKFYIETSIFLLFFIKLELMLTQKA